MKPRLRKPQRPQAPIQKANATRKVKARFREIVFEGKIPKDLESEMRKLLPRLSSKKRLALPAERVGCSPKKLAHTALVVHFKKPIMTALVAPGTLVCTQRLRLWSCRGLTRWLRLRLCLLLLLLPSMLIVTA